MPTKTKLRELLEQAAAVFDDTASKDLPYLGELLGPLDEVLKAAGLKQVGRGTIEFISEDIAEEGACADFEPGFSILVHEGEGFETFIDLPTVIVDAQDPLAEARAYAAKKKPARQG